VKQIVGGTLDMDDPNALKTNFVSSCVTHSDVNLQSLSQYSSLGSHLQTLRDSTEKMTCQVDMSYNLDRIIETLRGKHWLPGPVSPWYYLY
jgi:hypothetical protein